MFNRTSKLQIACTQGVSSKAFSFIEKIPCRLKIAEIGLRMEVLKSLSLKRERLSKSTGPVVGYFAHKPQVLDQVKGLADVEISISNSLKN